MAVAAGHHKRTMFTLDERLGMARELSAKYPNVEVMTYDGCCATSSSPTAAKVVVRGLRAVSDFEYEFQMAGMNRQLMPDVETLFLTPSDQYQFISSTFVREIALLGGEVSVRLAVGQPAPAGRTREGLGRVTRDGREPRDGAHDHRQCINCDVCEPECPNRRSAWARRSTRSIPAAAPSASATSTSRSACRSAGRVHSGGSGARGEPRIAVGQYRRLTAVKSPPP